MRIFNPSNVFNGLKHFITKSMYGTNIQDHEPFKRSRAICHFQCPKIVIDTFEELRDENDNDFFVFILVSAPLFSVTFSLFAFLSSYITAIDNYIQGIC